MLIHRPSSGVLIMVRVGGKNVEAQLVSTNKKTVWVKLADGNIIKRKKRVHL